MQSRTAIYTCDLLVVIFAAVLAGCASVSVNKVNHETGKVVEDAAEGLRFYLPRPYVSVFEPFIVASDVYLANGELSADGNYVLLTQVPQGLDAIVNQKLKNNATQSMGPLAIDARRVIPRDTLSVGPQGAAVAGTAAPGGGETGTPGETTDKTTKPEASSPAGGILNFKAINDNAAFAVTPQPRYFNILWLPDFDEQYVVSAKAGLGNTGVIVTTGQGWSLQGLDAKIDNSAVVKPLLDFYSGTLGALQKLATAKIQAPLALLSGGTESGPQGAAIADTKSAKAEFKGGTPVTVKVTKVRIVAPGLYPVLKPKEIASAALTDDEKKRILMPKPPFTNIAFNTYDVIVIEAARTTGDSALRIQQYVDSTTPGAGAAPENPTTPPSAKKDPLKDSTDKLNIVLSKPENMTSKGQFYVAKLMSSGDAIKVQLSLGTGGSGGTRAALPEEAVTKKLVIETLASLGVIVTSDNISVAK